jgi:hypothetical protein
VDDGQFPHILDNGTWVNNTPRPMTCCSIIKTKETRTMSTNDQPNATAQNVTFEGMTLHVANVECALEFYTKIPGAQVQMHRRGSFALLSIGGGRLSLLKEGPTHLEFGTPDPDALYEQFKAAGLPVEDPPSQHELIDFILQYLTC